MDDYADMASGLEETRLGTSDVNLYIDVAISEGQIHGGMLEPLRDTMYTACFLNISICFLNISICFL